MRSIFILLCLVISIGSCENKSIEIDAFEEKPSTEIKHFFDYVKNGNDTEAMNFFTLVSPDNLLDKTNNNSSSLKIDAIPPMFNYAEYFRNRNLFFREIITQETIANKSKVIVSLGSQNREEIKGIFYLVKDNENWKIYKIDFNY